MKVVKITNKVKKVLLTALIFVAVITIILLNVDFQSVDDYYSLNTEPADSNTINVSLSINCEYALEKAEHLNDRQIELIGDGIILEDTKFTVSEDSTVFDLLKCATKSHKIQMEYQGADANIYNSIYIQGINYLYEYDCGNLSGWIYLVNGVQPDYSCGNYQLSDGDKVSWVYTLDLGHDVGGS